MRKLLLCAFACLFALKSDAKTCFLPMSDSCFPASSTSVETDCPEGYATDLEQCMAPNATCDNGWWLDTTKVLQFSGGKRCYLCTQSHLPADCNEALTETVCAISGLGFSQEDLCVGDETITCNRCIGTPCPEDHSLTADLTCDGSQHIQTFSQNALCGKCVCKDGYHTSANDCGSSGSSGWTFTKDNSSDTCGKCEAKTCETHNLVATCLTSNYTEHLHWLGDNQQICYDCNEDEVVCNDGYDKIETLTCNLTSETIELQPSEPRCAKCVCNANKNYVSSCQQGFSCQSPVGSCVKVIGCAEDYQNAPCAANLAQFGPYQLVGHTCWRCGPTCQSLGYQQSGSCSDPFDSESYVCNDSSPQTDAYGSICRTLTLKTCDKLKCRNSTSTITELEDGTGITCEVYNGTLSSISFRDIPQTGDIRAIVRSQNSNSSVECYTNEIQTCQSLGYEHKGSCYYASYDTYFFDCTESPTSTHDFWNNYCHKFEPKTCAKLKCNNLTEQSDGTFVCTASSYCSSNGCLWNLTDDTSKTPVTVQSGTDPSDTTLCYSEEIKTCQTEGYQYEGECPNANTYDSFMYSCSDDYVHTISGLQKCHKFEPKTCAKLKCNNLTEQSDGTFVCTASANCSSNGCLWDLTDDTSKTPVTVQSGTDQSDTKLCYSSQIKTCQTEGYQSEGKCPSTSAYDSNFYDCQDTLVSTNYGSKYCYKLEPKLCARMYCKNLIEHDDGNFSCTATSVCSGSNCIAGLNAYAGSPITVFNSDATDSTVCSANIRTCKTEGYQEGTCPSHDPYMYSCSNHTISATDGSRDCHKITPKTCSNLYCNNLTEQSDGTFVCTASAYCVSNGCLTALSDDTTKTPVTVQSSLNPSDTTLCYSSNIATCQTQGYQHEGSCPNPNTYDSAFYTCSWNPVDTNYGIKRCHKFEPKTCSNLYCNNLTEQSDGTFVCTASAYCVSNGCLTNLTSSGSPVIVFNSEATASTVCTANITTCASLGYTGAGECPAETTYNAAFYTCDDYYKSTSFGNRCYKLTPRSCGGASVNIRYCTGLFNDGETYKCRASSSSCSGSGCAQNLSSSFVVGGREIHVYENLNNPDSEHLICYARNYTL